MATFEQGVNRLGDATHRRRSGIKIFVLCAILLIVVAVASPGFWETTANASAQGSGDTDYARAYTDEERNWQWSNAIVAVGQGGIGGYVFPLGPLFAEDTYWNAASRQRSPY